MRYRKTKRTQLTEDQREHLIMGYNGLDGNFGVDCWRRADDTWMPFRTEAERKKAWKDHRAELIAEAAAAGTVPAAMEDYEPNASQN